MYIKMLCFLHISDFDVKIRLGATYPACFFFYCLNSPASGSTGGGGWHPQTVFLGCTLQFSDGGLIFEELTF